jgi:photosynthetic reaction center cytochrome c subunit
MRFLVTMLLVLLPLCAQDPPQKKGGGGGAPKNLKVLKPEDVRVVMGQYVAALGVADKGGCNFCHVQGDRASDEKPEKVTARAMIVMLNDVNAKMAAANLKTVVTCYTCHRGKTMPDTAPAGSPLP